MPGSGGSSGDQRAQYDGRRPVRDELTPVALRAKIVAGIAAAVLAGVGSAVALAGEPTAHVIVIAQHTMVWWCSGRQQRHATAGPSGHCTLGMRGSPTILDRHQAGSRDHTAQAVKTRGTTLRSLTSRRLEVESSRPLELGLQTGSTITPLRER